MVRTRDFLLFLITLAFLLTVISVETARQWFATSDRSAEVFRLPTFSDSESTPVSAVVVSPESIDRQANISRLRQQLASFAPPEPETPEPETLELETPKPETSVAIAVPEATSTAVVTGTGILPADPGLVCPSYRPYAGTWPNQLLSITEQEGVRVVAMGAVEGAGEVEQVVTVLPIRTIGNSLSPTCLPSDVVAIAQSGSLIRNADVAGYRAFPDHILIGYTLDGFPLYGNSTRETDQCGGVVVDGQYRYYLSSSRKTVIDCFVAPPIALP